MSVPVENKKKSPLVKILGGGCILLVLFIIVIAGCSAIFMSGGGDESPATSGAPVSETEEEAPAEEEEDSIPAAEDSEVSNDESLAAQVEEIQGQLDVWFEDCDWQNSEDSGIAQASCAEHEIGIIVGPGDNSVQGILDAMGEEGSGGYFLDDGVAVWSTDMGNVRMAWDVLGTPGQPTEF